MARPSIRMPLSQAGITRYFDEYRSRIEITPRTVIVLIVIAIILEILIHTLF
ncbi:preprotein translocase subunit Sec61beta [Candidatus Woesearchaeota archaeon]|nr:preprotein translocase subunit Sec61beta [Candidatus Woesearchaeota archaeon]